MMQFDVRITVYERISVNKEDFPRFRPDFDYSMPEQVLIEDALENLIEEAIIRLPDRKFSLRISSNNLVR